MPAYNGDEPVKANAQYTWPFTGWDPEPAAVTGDAVYTAQFDNAHPVVNTYTVTWKNWDGTVLETDTDVPFGVTPAYDGDKPVREDGQNTWVFIGWDPAVGPVTGDAVYTAKFENRQQPTDTYTIVWRNRDGSILETDENVPYGEMPSYDGETPTYANAQYTWTFTGWDPEPAAVTGSTVYTAQFDMDHPILNTYTVIWKNWDGEVLETDENVPYGQMPSYDGETPVREEEAYVWTFTGWDPAVTAVTGNAEYTAVFNGESRIYTVTVTTDGHGTASASPVSGPAGTLVTLTVNSVEDRYQFKEWQVLSGGVTISGNTFRIGTQNVEILAVFEEIVPPEPMDLTIEIFNYQPGVNSVPAGIEDLELKFAVQILKGKQIVSETEDVQTITVSGGDKKIVLENVRFDRKIEGLNGFYKVSVTGLPKSVTVGTGEDMVTYRLSYDAWIKNDGTILIYLRWGDFKGNNEEEFRSVPLPEDEIGAYKLLPDGSKEYLIFQTYEICMRYLNNEEECAGHERCFHKEGYYGIDWWPVVIR